MGIIRFIIFLFPMEEARRPNTIYLVFLLFFTLTDTIQTTGSVKCQTGLLRYPFGFSDGYPIRLNCSKTTGDAEIGEFAVQEVTGANVFVKIPPMCDREIRKIEQLFRENLAPSTLQNIILVQGCKEEQSSSCSIKQTFIEPQLNISTCISPVVNCVEATTRTTAADVMSIGDVVNRSCKYWLSSITIEPSDTISGVSFNMGRLKLDWWLKEGCSNTSCSENANCTDVKLADGKLGHRCKCLDGFHGDAFTVADGCRRIGIGLASGLAVVILIAGGLFRVISWRRKTSDNPRLRNLKALIPLKHYSYAEVKRITKSFAEVVGKGGFGTVYRGTLCDGRSVAVKVLKDSKGNGEDFINEVASMSKTSHVNIVSLLGFCSEGTKRAILYEYVENGSLDKFISGKMTSMNMDWMALYGIAVGVARGLEYLHYGCKTRIVHFDIKPPNILLDKNLCPKVSDFGLAKLCENKESIMSLLDTRGTIGYIAPEMISRVYGSVSHKSDVYSYGMLVLEMIGARNRTSTEHSESNRSSMYFPEWIYKDLEKGNDRKLNTNAITSEEEEIAKKMTLVGLWCIQSSPSDRPPMNKVVEMMEGSLDALEVPPRPVLQIPAAPFQESSTLSEIILFNTEV